MALGSSIVLGLHITICTLVIDTPVICVMPTTHPVMCTSPICLSYAQDTDEHAGHYDLVVPLDDEQHASTVKAVRCTCGRMLDAHVFEQRGSAKVCVYTRTAVTHWVFDILLPLPDSVSLMIIGGIIHYVTRYTYGGVH